MSETHLIRHAVDCHDEIGSDLHVVGGSSIVKIHANGSHTNTLAQEDSDVITDNANNTIAVEEGERKKGSIVVDVIIEAIFIVGEYSTERKGGVGCVNSPKQSPVSEVSDVPILHTPVITTSLGKLD